MDIAAVRTLARTLADAADDIESCRLRLQSGLDCVEIGPPLFLSSLTAAARELSEEIRWRADAMQEADRQAAWTASDRQFLLFDPKGAGRIAEVHGDLDAAANLAVVVPGMSNDQGNFDHLSGNAHNLYQQSGKAHSGTTTATIAWFGYHSPHGADVLVGTNAEKGGRELANFVRGLAVHGDKHLTLIGHSYGTTVVANAVSHHGVHADDLVFVGSPGFGDDHVNLGDARLWYGQAKGDPVCFFGPDDKGAGPADYGATRFPTTGAHGHSEYFAPGNRSLGNIAAISAGHPEAVGQ